MPLGVGVGANVTFDRRYVIPGIEVAEECTSSPPLLIFLSFPHAQKGEVHGITASDLG